MHNISNAQEYKASAPASLKILGEYAVLDNKPAIIAAVDYRITTKIRPRSDSKITISSALGQYSTDMENITIEKPLQFVLATLKHFRSKMSNGCDINIDSNFLSTVGLGSSAAATVSAVAAMTMWLGIKLAKDELLKLSHKIVLDVQKVASGADLAACVFGGVVYYKKDPMEVIHLSNKLPLTMVYSGSKTTTSVAISRVEKIFATMPAIKQEIYELIGKCSDEAKNLLKKEDWPALGNIFNIHNGLQESLCTGTDYLSSIIYKLRAYNGIFGAKISGSGFGDCAIGLGNIPDNSFPHNDLERERKIEQIPISISSTGVIYHDY